MGNTDGELTDLDALERLSIIEKVAQELENHIKINDLDLAEFILHLVETSNTIGEFSKKLEENEADFSEALIKNLFRIIKLLTKKPIQPKKPNHTSNESSNQHDLAEQSSFSRQRTESNEKLSKLLPVLALPNDYSHVEALRQSNNADVALEALEELENLEEMSSKSKNLSTTEKKSEKPVSRNYYGKYRSSPKVGGIYDGVVKRVLEYGCFVTIYSIESESRREPAFKSSTDGLVHVSQITEKTYVSDARNFIKVQDRVKVKVLSIIDRRLKFSMKEVDQESGNDLALENGTNSQNKKSSHAKQHIDQIENEDWTADDDFDFFGEKKNFANYRASGSKKFKRNTDYERFEIAQLKNACGSAVAKKLNLNRFSQSKNHENGEGMGGDLSDIDLSSDEEVDIEILEEGPAFLKGYGKKVLNDLSPVKVIKNPEGSMSQAAQIQAEISKERREQKNEQINAIQAEMKHDKQSNYNNRNWLDPMNNSESVDFETGLKKGEISLINQRQSSNSSNLLQTNAEWKKYLPSAYSRKFAESVKRTNKTILDQRESLPIFSLKTELLKAIADNNCLVVVGETGSGKTTQMTQYLVESGYASGSDKNIRRIGCTQPRRVAAMSVAKRVSEEYGCQLGQQVGYTIRFEDKTSHDTLIKYMTDGMLMRECLVDPDLRQYSVIMLDEAHERTISTDVLFGLLKEALRKRPDDLKIIVTSATLDAVKFSEYFFECPIFTIPGRTFPVEIFYSKDPETDYVDAALITVMQIHLNESQGDILVFLTGQEEIDTACEVLYRRISGLGEDVPELIILPVYGTLPSEMQQRIFDPAPPGSRKVIFATNIAETSLTIDGIFYVVDPGFVKQKVYNSKSGIDQLLVTPISQAQANQRSGRAGRTGPGKCFRLYTEKAFQEEMLPTQVPEIQRTNMCATVLQLKALGINNLLSFDFMDPPPPHTLINALENLHALGAIDNEGLLTKLGRRMAEFPLDPMLSKILIMSVHLGCSEEILTIVSMLSVENVFYRPKDKQEEANRKKARFDQPEGDHLTLLTIFNRWLENGSTMHWCRENFLHNRTLKRAHDVRKQMLGIMDRHKLKIASSGKDYTRVQKAIVSGYFRHAAKRDSTEGGYRSTIDDQLLYIHPSSSLYQRQPQWIVYSELVMTSREYAHNVTAIDSKWLLEFAPNFYRKASIEKINKQRSEQKLKPLYDWRDPEGKLWRISQLARPSNPKVTFG